MSPGPKPPYQADTVTAKLNSTSGASAPRVGSRMNLAAKAARTQTSANPYLFNLRLNKFIHRPFTSPLTKYRIRDQHPDSRFPVFIALLSDLIRYRSDCARQEKKRRPGTRIPLAVSFLKEGSCPAYMNSGGQDYWREIETSQIKEVAGSIMIGLTDRTFSSCAKRAAGQQGFALASRAHCALPKPRQSVLGIGDLKWRGQ